MRVNTYQIKIKGHLSSQWSEWFEDLIFSHHEDGTTILTGEIVDQSALNGVLNTIHSLNLELISVTRLKELGSEAEQDPSDLD